MREPKAAWVAALKAMCGSESDLRWNEEAYRWEFSLMSADGVMRSQFWGNFRRPVDPVTGLHPFRELDDAAMNEALSNLERTYIGNPFNGAGTTRREVMKRYRYNRDLQGRKYMEAAEAFADMAAERGHRLRGSPMIQVATSIGTKG